MKLALIADTHLPRGNRRLPDRCLELIRGADLLIHAGDISTARTLAELRAVGPPVRAIHGNVDSAELRAELPEQVLLELDGLRLAVVHDAGPAAGRARRLRIRFPDADAVVFGHTHMPQHERLGDFQIFNPGSPTERRRAPHRSMGTATIEGGGVEFRHWQLD
jgi:putative phosphoesterase